ncbi:MAG: hypothetical protein J6R59_10245 [Paludibacteraceae bacterium]|nr:hypothetical protein [Paludibacteraceae bacterium]
MICYRCKKIHDCTAFQTLYNTSKDFSVNDCKHFDEELSSKYKKLAENDNLMHLIYDYFLGQVEVDATEEEVVRVIKNALLNL